ncbi:MAG: hypothetical protein ACOVO5_12800 [Devosia sp.]|jgi:hypothetical protein|uniref:hypothetical protein n=1 Tax=Devosia sp. TaxID=1871048 RepID=UPI0037C01E8E
MKTCWFIVIRTPSAWWVDCEGKAYGPFGTREDAASNAIRLAQTFGDAQRRSDVYVPDAEEKLTLVWSGAAPRRSGSGS